eukprot:161612_1
MKSITPLVVSLLALLPAASLAFMNNNNSQRQNTPGQQNKAPTKNTSLNLYRSAAEAIAEAERVCLVEGPYSDRCKVAWDIVEEFQAADSHDRAPATPQNDGLNYSPLVSSLEILSVKIEKKMDELNKLSSQLAELGAGPEVERLVYATMEMKQVIAEARAATD